MTPPCRLAGLLALVCALALSGPAAAGPGVGKGVKLGMTVATFSDFDGGMAADGSFANNGMVVGTIFLAVCFMRGTKGHFKPDQHFGFEAAAWYWHFVDVVWLFLFSAVYWWGAGNAALH